MSGLRYASGEEPMVGDVLESAWRGKRGDFFDGEATVTEVHDRMIVATAVSAKTGFKQDVRPKDSDVACWRLVRRATPATDEREAQDERFAVGAVWLGATPQYDHAIRGTDAWYLLERQRNNSLLRVPSGTNKWASANSHYAGNLSGLINFLIAWGKAAKRVTFNGIPVIADPTMPRNTYQLRYTVTAEELLASQRAKHAAESAALQERYAAFRATVERVVKEEAPRARVVTDVYRSKRDGQGRFVAFFTCGDLSQHVAAGPEESLHRYEAIARQVTTLFRDTLGARLLRGTKGERS